MAGGATAAVLILGLDRLLGGCHARGRRSDGDDIVNVQYARIKGSSAFIKTQGSELSGSET
jgi:hypothetical protein